MKKEKLARNTVVYSGSFNPIHLGHSGIIWVLSTRFDQEVVVVSKHNPLKDEESLDDFDKRLMAVNEEVNSMKAHHTIGDNVEVSDVERFLPDPSYTYNTLLALKKSSVNGETYTLAVGADCLGEIHKWKEWRKIINEFGLVVIPREGYNLNKFLFKLFLRKPNILFGNRITVFRDVKIPKISSTEIRERNAKK